MKTTYRLFIITFFTFFSMIVTDIHVEAKRFGGGRSIGNTPSISRSFSAMKQRTPQRQSSIFQQGSVLGGMGGIFTGLLAGTLLGSLLGGGAFSKISIIDILVFGGIIFLLYKLLTWKRHSVSTQYHYANTATERTTPLWTHLEDTDNKEHLQQTFSIQDGGIENFDIESFLKGAKLLFNRMQDSWASRDLEDIKKFTTKNIFTDITQQAQEDPTPSPIVVIHLQIMNKKTYTSLKSGDLFVQETQIAHGSLMVSHRYKSI